MAKVYGIKSRSRSQSVGTIGGWMYGWMDLFNIKFKTLYRYT